MDINDFKEAYNKQKAFKIKVKKASSSLKIDGDNLNVSKGAAAAALATITPAVPIALAGDIASGLTSLAGDAVAVTGLVLASPSALIASGLFIAGSMVYNPVAKAALYTVGTVAAIPAVATVAATVAAGAIIKLGASIISGLTLAAVAPFKAAAVGILKLSQKKHQKENDEVIEIEVKDIDDDEIEME